MELFEKSYPVIHPTKGEILTISKILVLDNVLNSIRLVLWEAVAEVNSLTMP